MSERCPTSRRSGSFESRSSVRGESTCRLRALGAASRVAVVLVALSVSACSSGSSVPNAHVAGPTNGHVDAVVMLKDVSFEPQLVTIHVGQAVEWIWEDAPVAHNVTFTNFASPTQATGTFIHTFTRPGTFPYRCTIHSDMTGTVAVVP